MAESYCVQELGTETEFKNFIKEGIVLIDFFADWCMPCMMMIPVVDDLCEHFIEKAKVAKVNVGENQELAMKYNVSSIPNFTIFKDGQVVEQFVGSMSFEELAEKIERWLE